MDLIYFVSKKENLRNIQSRYFDIKRSALLSERQYLELRETVLHSGSSVVIVENPLDKILNSIKPGVLIPIRISLRSHNDFNTSEDVTRRRTVQSRAGKNGDFEIVEITGESDPTVNNNYFISEKMRFRKKTIDGISKTKWSLETTKTKLLGVSEVLLKTGYAGIELTKEEIEDIMSNGRKLISGIALVNEITINLGQD